MAEIHCHGSKAIINAIVDAWQAQDSLRLRLAEPDILITLTAARAYPLATAYIVSAFFKKAFAETR